MKSFKNPNIIDFCITTYNIKGQKQQVLMDPKRGQNFCVPYYFVCIVTPLLSREKGQKNCQEFTCIANKRTLRQNYLWRMKIFLTSEFWEIAIWSLNPKNLLNNFFSKSFFRNSIWLHMFFDLTFINKILIFFITFTNIFPIFLVNFWDFWKRTISDRSWNKNEIYQNMLLFWFYEKK